MKKVLILFFVFLCFILYIKLYNNSDIQATFMEKDKIGSHYKLIFDDEPLTIRAIKLKLHYFVNSGYITKIYIKYNNNVEEYFEDKKYFSFDNSNIDVGIETLKREYLDILKNNYLYDEIEKNINDVVIESVDVYAEEEVINKFKDKFSKVKIVSLN